MGELDLEAMVMAETKRLETDEETVLAAEAADVQEEEAPAVEIGVKVETPGPSSPGFLRRLRNIAHFQAAMEEGKFTPAVVDSLVDFLLAYIVEPESREEARGIVLDFSEEQFNEIMGRLSGGEAEVPPPSKSS